jgi:hypothetical protein
VRVLFADARALKRIGRDPTAGWSAHKYLPPKEDKNPGWRARANARWRDLDRSTRPLQRLSLATAFNSLLRVEKRTKTGAELTIPVHEISPFGPRERVPREPHHAPQAQAGERPVHDRSETKNPGNWTRLPGLQMVTPTGLEPMSST